MHTMFRSQSVLSISINICVTTQQNLSKIWILDIFDDVLLFSFQRAIYNLKLDLTENVDTNCF